ncbi:Transmembrane protein [Phytophthora megakarya]|uniref:Transmembrane protein n=1 Tax=Phytophthora megakarya TaxID=4795 RepID=A0A225VL63_9STRA|nr:Transmembrane protein [Phytophthora megakarya]
MNSTMASNRTTRSNTSSSSSRSHSRRKTEKNRAKSVATADFRGTNPIMEGSFQEEEQVERVPTLDDRGHINFTNSRYKKAVDSAKRSVRARGALPAGSARSQDPFNPISPTRTSRTQTLDIQEDDEEDEYDNGNDCRRQFQQDAVRLQRRDRGRARKQSIYASWSYCGHSFPNWFLRLCTAIAIVPLVVCGLIFWPVLAAAVLTTILLCFCCYEHAWLSFRIHKQLLATYEWYEGSEGPMDIGDAADASTRSNASVVCGYQDAGYGDRRFKNSFTSSAVTQSTTSFPTDTVLGSEDGMSFLTTNDEDFAGPKRVKHQPSICQLELETSRGILLGLANLLFCGNLWMTRIAVAAMITICWSVFATMIFPLMPFPVAETPRDIASAPYYFYVINFMASLCAVSCPTWSHAISLIVQKSAFEVLLLNAFNCPLSAARECIDPPITSMQTFVLGAMTLILVHALSARGPANLVAAVSLDLLGYSYIAGALGLLISMVDPSDHKNRWAIVWLGMLSAMWVAQLAGYLCDAIMLRFQIPHIRLLPPRIVVTLDVEASLCAIAAGSLVLVFGGAILNVPGGVLPKVLFSVGSVLTARFGRLIISLLKKAAGVRWSGRIMPGFGGALDGSHALLFTSIVFVKYYLYVVARQTSKIDDIGSGSSENWATVTFSTDLRS